MIRREFSDIKKLEKKHRTIGIRHVLKQFKKEGLIDDDTFYASEAVDQIQDEITRVAVKWYLIGASRGAKEAIGCMKRGSLKLRKDSDGKKQVTSRGTQLSWTRRLNVKVGGRKKHIKKTKWVLDIDDLGIVRANRRLK